VALQKALNSTCDARLFWPMVLQINSQCKAKKVMAEKFLKLLDSSYIIGSVLLNELSYTRYHHSQRDVHSSAMLPSLLETVFLQSETQQDVTPSTEIKYPTYLTLDATERLKSLDSLQLHSPIFSDGYALAYAEYTQKFVLQVYGEFHTGIQGFRGECTEAGNFGTSGSNDEPEKPNCQLTFEQKLNSVFPLTDSSSSVIGRTSDIDKGALRATLLACITARSLHWLLHPLRPSVKNSGVDFPSHSHRRTH
jgi:hypothetical protein